MSDHLDPIYDAALPKDAPGAWIRKAIERKRREIARNCSTCNGWNPVTEVRQRETAGLVCQSCGWDYGDGEP